MPAKKTIYMESTEVPADRSAADISAALVRAGATSVSLRYDEGKIAGMSWTMKVGSVVLPFTMPARVDPVYRILKSRANGNINNAMAEKIRGKAERIAWRQLLRWVLVQLAMIETGMAERGEVFMPYMQQSDGSTFFEYFKSKQLALPAPETKQ